MAACALRGVAEVDHSLLGNADYCGRGDYLREETSDYCAALIENQSGRDAAALKEIDDVGCAVTGDLLIAAECKVDVGFRNKVLIHQSLGGVEHRRDSYLGIKSAAAIEEAIAYLGLKGRTGPPLAVRRDYVVVSHKDGGTIAFLALPSKEQAAISNFFECAVFIYYRENIRQSALKLLELEFILLSLISRGDGLALDKTRELGYRAVGIYGELLCFRRLFFMRLKAYRTKEEHR